MRINICFLKKISLLSLAGAFVFGLAACSNFLDETIKEETKKEITIVNKEGPVAKVEEPAFLEDGVAKNKAIVISFTLPVDTQSFMDNFSISDSLGNNLKSYFKEPQWSNGNKLVKISADETNLMDLHGKKYMDIYVTLSKSCKSLDNVPLQYFVDYKYRVCDRVDNLPPDIISVKAELPDEYINLKSDNVVSLIEGEITDENENEICQTNHINSKIDFYIEGNDYGGGEVTAHLVYKRIYDAAGNEVFEEEKQYLSKLEKINEYGNYFEKFCLDLSGDEYLDGMYKITATVVDSSNLDSEENKVFYIIRDTTFTYNANALMWFETPLYRKDAVLDFDTQVATEEDIEFFRNRIQFSNIQDDIFYVSKTGTETTYKESYEDFTYYFSWGLDFDKLTEPVKIAGEVEDNPAYTANPESQKIYTMPVEFQNFCKYYEDTEIILKATVVDSVGNKNEITTLIPGKVELYNYEVLDELTEEGFKKVRLNYSDMSSDVPTLSKLPNKTSQAIYRIYYSKLDEQEIDEDAIKLLPLTRNTFVSFEEDPDSIITDNPVLELEENSKYIVYIQSSYIMNSKTNGQWCGQTFGPLYKVVVDSNASSFISLEPPEFNVQKESAGANTGLCKINVQITNPQNDVRYVPCYSLDNGENWIYYNSEDSDDFSFVVTNPLKAPLAKGQAWDKIEWQNKNYFNAVNDVSSIYSFDKVNAKIKILAIKENKSKESEIETIVFTEDDDNIPPSHSEYLNNHDSILSFDGHSFSYDSLIIENEGHALKYFNYYYMPYNEAWGSNLSVIDPQQIENLSGGISVLESKTWRDKDGARYSLSPVIPINGLKDGKYMFFAKVMDSYGNYSFITLGKANIGTFKNKLNVQYDTQSRSFISRLNLEQSEKFDRNMINIQIWNNNSSKKWDNFYGVQNELQDCLVAETGNRRTLYNKTENKHSYYENEQDLKKEKKIEKNQPVIGGSFYRLTVQSFNENTYNDATGQGVNIRYGRPYNNNLKKETVVDYVNGETDYDLCTDETVSNTVYYYVPSSENELKNFKSSFFTSTASPRSNKPFIVNVICSMVDHGNNIDEWERRGTLVKTHGYENSSESLFNDNIAMNDMIQSELKGSLYYVIIVHFADNSSAISSVYQIQN